MSDIVILHLRLHNVLLYKLWLVLQCCNPVRSRLVANLEVYQRLVGQQRVEDLLVFH
jgi:hypothetical protein